MIIDLSYLNTWKVKNLGGNYAEIRFLFVILHAKRAKTGSTSA